MSAQIMTFGPRAAARPRQPGEEWVRLGEVIRLLKPDRSEAERFLTALDPASTWWTFQTFDDSTARRKQRAEDNKQRRKEGKKSSPDPFAKISHASLTRHYDALTELNERGAGIFICVNETDGKGRGIKNVVRVRALFIDLDGAPLPEAFHLKPHVIVESSPGKFHAYWRVRDCPLEQFEPLQKGLVMRVPGFVHRKDEPFHSRLIEVSEHGAYTAKQVADGLLESIKAEKPKPEPRDPDPEGNGSDVDNVPPRGLLFPGLNTYALTYLDRWVPELFPQAMKREDGKGWRVSSSSLGRTSRRTSASPPRALRILAYMTRMTCGKASARPSRSSWSGRPRGTKAKQFNGSATRSTSPHTNDLP
jgi:hypothetical protein